MLTAADRSTEPERRPARLGFFHASNQTPACPEAGAWGFFVPRRGRADGAIPQN
jgi:hypothetical protein